MDDYDPTHYRVVQGWMALDLHLALGLAYDPWAKHQGHGSWADWWAELCAEVRRRNPDKEGS